MQTTPNTGSIVTLQTRRTHGENAADDARHQRAHETEFKHNVESIEADGFKVYTITELRKRLNNPHNNLLNKKYRQYRPYHKLTSMSVTANNNKTTSKSISFREKIYKHVKNGCVCAETGKVHENGDIIDASISHDIFAINLDEDCAGKGCSISGGKYTTRRRTNKKRRLRKSRKHRKHTRKR